MQNKNIRTVKVENLFKGLIFEGLKEVEVKEGKHGVQVELQWKRYDYLQEKES